MLPALGWLHPSQGWEIPHSISWVVNRRGQPDEKGPGSNDPVRCCRCFQCLIVLEEIPRPLATAGSKLGNDVHDWNFEKAPKFWYSSQ
jgi:hypothetical protein